MQFQLTPYALPVIAATILAAWIGFYSWQRRSTRNAFWLVPLSAALTTWLIFYTLQISGANLFTKVIFGEAKYLGVATTPLFWFFFAFQYSGQGQRYLSRRWMAFLALIPVLTGFFALTTHWHGLFWSEPVFVQSADFADFNVAYGPWYWVHLVYSYFLILGGTFLVFRSLRQGQGLRRRQALALIISVLAPWVANILYFSGANPIPYLDLTPFAFTITVSMLTWAILGFRLVDLAPIARDLVVDKMKDGMLVIDAQGKVVDINPAAEALFGRSGTEMLGQPLEQFLSLWPELFERYRLVTETLTEFSLGAERWFELQISPLSDPKNRFLGRVIVLREITARKQIEQALSAALHQSQEANRLKSQLLARVSHELRTPLGGVMGYAELLKLDALGPLSLEQKEAATQILASAIDLDQMIGQLLDQAQLETGMLSLNRKNFPLARTLELLSQKFGEQAQAKGLVFELELAPNLPESFFSDEARLIQILNNLLGNAVKFTASGRVLLKVYRSAEARLAFEVSDTGPGIPLTAQEYIFEPFRQVDPAITRDNRGAGLGLSITWGLVKLLEGEIHLESQVGRGSTFTVCLPDSGSKTPE